MYQYNSKNHFYTLQLDIELINQFILKIQRLIYLAARRYNYIELSKYQRKLISLREEVILTSLYQGILKIKKNGLSNFYCKKFLTVTYFIILKKYHTSLYSLKLIRAQIIKSIIFSLLQPEWLAKLEHNSIVIYQKKPINIDSKNLYEFIKISDPYKSKKQILLSCTNYKDKSIIKKICTNNILSNQLYALITRQNHQEYKSIINNYLDKNNNLDQLLKVITFIGSEWLIYINFPYKYIYSNICLVSNTTSYLYFCNLFIIPIIFKCLIEFFSNQLINLKDIKCSILDNYNNQIHIGEIKLTIKGKLINRQKLSTKSLEYLIEKIRLQLYHKNNQGFWRRNNYISIHKILFLTTNLIKFWYSYYLNLLSSFDKKQVNRTLNTILYLWQRKNKKNNR